LAFLLLDDKHFRDFNYSRGLEPNLLPGSGPTEAQLSRWVLQARGGDRGASHDLAETMHTTLRPAAFEAFQRVCGPRPIEFRDFFFSKLLQLSELLGSDLPDPEVLEAAYDPGAWPDHWWLPMVTVCLAGTPEGAGARLQSYLGQLAGERLQCSAKPKRRRDRIVAECLATGMDRHEICEELDRCRVPTTGRMREGGCTTWCQADDHKDFRRNIQTMFSKVKAEPDVNK
jgi:hypothetical protein